MRRSWTSDEIALLERYYPDGRMTQPDLEALLNRNWGAIKMKAICLGLSRLRPDTWTNDKITLLEQYYPNGRVTPNEMEKLFGCHWKAIQLKAHRLGLRRPRLDQREWTQDEIAALERYYSNEQIRLEEMENLLNRTWMTIKWKARSLGLRRPERNIYHANRNYFKHITSERAAYWLGLLAADGSVTNTNGHYVAMLALNNLIRY